VILPAGPDPATWYRSTPASRARCRTAGAASGLVPGARSTTGPATATGSGTGVGSGAGVGSGSATGSGVSSTAGAAGSGSLAEALPSPSTSNSMQTTPTGRISPASPMIFVTVPSHGAGISTVALSVMTERIGSSSLTVSPTATIHSTTSPSTTPSPISGSLNANVPMFIPPVFSLWLQQCAEDLANNPTPLCEGMACPIR